VVQFRPSTTFNADELNIDFDISCKVAKKASDRRAPAAVAEASPGHITLMLTISARDPCPPLFIILGGLKSVPLEVQREFSPHECTIVTNETGWMTQELFTQYATFFCGWVHNQRAAHRFNATEKICLLLTSNAHYAACGRWDRRPLPFILPAHPAPKKGRAQGWKATWAAPHRKREEVSHDPVVHRRRTTSHDLRKQRISVCCNGDDSTRTGAADPIALRLAGPGGAATPPRTNLLAGDVLRVPSHITPCYGPSLEEINMFIDVVMIADCVLSKL
jgi:hypothetical protein